MALLFSEEAEEDIVSILRYLAQYSPAAAQKLYENIFSTCELIAEQKRIGIPRPQLMDDLYGFPEPPYLILYWIHGDDILISRVLHMSRDIESLL